MYSLLDAMGALGGMVSLLMIIFKNAIYPISQHMYYWVAIKKLFFARTATHDLLLEQKEGNLKSSSEYKISRYLRPEEFGLEDELLCNVKKEIKKHKLIRISW